MFKKTLAIAFAVLSGSLSHASVELSSFTVQPSQYDALSLLNWKVGDSSDYQIKAVFGKIGTLHKEVTKEEGNAVWLHQNLDAGSQKDLTEMLIDRDSGKILKMIHNGKEQKIPDEKPEIVSQDYTQVTVPAGTFKALHVVAKTKKVKRIEFWVNNRDVVIDGAVKQMMATQFGDITLELTEQHRED